MKKTILSLFLIMLTALVTGCNNKAKGLVGKWKAEGVAVDYYYVFNDDKTCAYETIGASIKCTYKDEGNKVEIIYVGNTDANTYEYKIEDNKLIIKDSLGNDVIYVRQ